MSETKHTPGPWGAELSPYRRTLSVVSETTWICGELLNPSTMPEEEAWANARLIASAPDLLAALKLAKHMFIANELDLPRTFEVIDAAISKAEGRS